MSEALKSRAVSEVRTLPQLRSASGSAHRVQQYDAYSLTQLLVLLQRFLLQSWEEKKNSTDEIAGDYSDLLMALACGKWVNKSLGRHAIVSDLAAQKTWQKQTNFSFKPPDADPMWARLEPSSSSITLTCPS